jgi:integrase
MARVRRRFGRVQELPSGRFRARYPGPDGVLRSAPNTFLTRTDADRWLSVVESDLLRGTWIDPAAGRVPLGEYAVRWIDERPGLAPRTVELYRSLLHRHITPTLGAVMLNDVTPARVRSWRKALLDGGTGAVTVAKVYRLLKAVLNTAVDDELIRRNPCRIKGAGTEPSPERPTITIEQVYAIAQEVRPWFRALVLLAAFTGLRWGELLALRRRHLELDDGVVKVRASLGEIGGQFVEGPPKSAAGRRDVAIPEAIVPELRAHLDEWSQEGAGGRVFVGPHGATPRRGNFQVTWSKAVDKAGVPGLHFHDLRHTGNTLAAEGASLRELMARMGHNSPRAALIYQHATRDRERAIGAAISARIEAARPPATDTIGTRQAQRAGGRRRRDGGDGRPDQV